MQQMGTSIHLTTLLMHGLFVWRDHQHVLLALIATIESRAPRLHLHHGMCHV